MLGGEVKGEDCSHRQTARYDRMTLLPHQAVLVLHCIVPVFPASAPEVVGTAAMPGKLWDVYRVAGVGEAQRDIAHFGWRSAEPMNKEKARISSS